MKNIKKYQSGSNIALSLIVKSSDKEAELLYRCLQNTSPFVDDIFITITNKKGEKPNDEVYKIAKSFGAKISYFEWVNDFSKARNFNFKQVPKDYDYILWCDADDVFRGLVNLKETIKKHPADVYSLNYLYSFDEFKNPIVVHQKTQIIKNDGCVEWSGALHEDFKNNRELKRYFIKGIERLHLTDEERINDNKERNLEVSEQQLKDLPNDPRSYWNVGNSLKALGRNQEAIKMFEKFVEVSNSDDEKYIVKLRMAESYWGLNERKKAIDEARYAIGIKPEYPDAYHLLGSLYFESKQFEKAKEMYLMGLIKKPPYYSIIVYNPRDYDFVPMMNLAKTYFALNLPQLALPLLEGCLKIYPKDEKTKSIVKLMKVEAKKADKVLEIAVKLRNITDKNKLLEELNKIPQEYQSHPAICNLRNINFQKKTSSGKDLVIFCGYTEEQWTPETAKTKGIGGSEEAVIWISKLLVQRGWNVIVYNNCGHKELEFDGVKYRPFWSWNYRDKQDIVILWRTPRMADHDINADKIVVDMHDVVPEGEFTEERLKRIDKIFVKSNFHRSLFPKILDDKFMIVPNGIDFKLFSETKKDKMLLINTSSPDRSLRALIDCFREVKKQVPEAKCKWAYGWKVFDVVHGDNPKMMEWKGRCIQDMKEVGIEEMGRVSHGEVAELYKKGQIFAYPSEFAEIDCISLTKAMASGAIPITTDFAAMGDKKNDYGIFIHSDKTKDNWCLPYQIDFSLQDKDKQKQWIDEVVKIFKLGYNKDITKLKDQAKKYDWKNIVDVWDNYLHG